MSGCVEPYDAESEENVEEGCVLELRLNVNVAGGGEGAGADTTTTLEDRDDVAGVELKTKARRSGFCFCLF